MQFIRKTLMFLLCAVMILSFAACSRNTDSPDPTDAPEATAEPETTAEPEATEEPEATDEPEATEAPLDDGSLTEWEQDAQNTLDDLYTSVTDETYVETVSAWLADPETYSGGLFQLEGVYETDGESSWLVRTVVDGDQRTDLRLPLENVAKNLESGGWARVLGIFQAKETDGETTGSFAVVTIEILDEAGQAELPAV